MAIQNQSIRRSIRLFAAAVLGMTGAFAATLLNAGVIDGPVASADAPTFYMFDNGNLRFGGNADNTCWAGCAGVTTPEDSLSALGLPKQPFYYSSANASWYKLTYSTYPLNLAIGTGTGGSNWSGANVTDITSLSGLVIDTSGFVTTGYVGTGVTGYGALEATGTVTVNGADFRITNRSELGPDGSFVKIATTITNISGAPATNTTMWVGTQDDYVGVSDVPTKTKGNIVDGAFAPTTTDADPASALMIESGPEGVLFYSTTLGANSSIDTCCSFSEAYRVNPAASPRVLTNDGSYAMNLPVADLADGESTQIVWFYAAGATADLPEVINEVFAAARPAAPTVIPGNTAATADWGAPESIATITDYIVRYRADGTSDAWTEVRKGDGVAPLSLLLTGLVNGTLYEVQVTAVTGTTPSEVVGAYSTSALVTPGNPTNSTLPTIAEAPLVGSTLTVSDPDGQWLSVDGTPMTASYQWTAGGTPITGATEATFLVTADQVGAAIAVVATRTNTSGPTSVVAVATPAVPDVYLADLTTSQGSLTPTFSPTTLSYAKTVAADVAAIDVIPTAPTGAAISVDGHPLGGDPSATITLAPGTTTNIVVAVSRDSDTLTYALAITRPGAPVPDPQPPTPDPEERPTFEPVTPERLVDTRLPDSTIPQSAAGTVLEIDVAGYAGVPADATSVMLNVAVTGRSTAGYLTVYPCGSDRPATSNLNVTDAQTVANAVFTQIGTSGKVCIYMSTDVDVIVDVNGYFDSTASTYLPLTPARLADTRDSATPVAGGTVLEVDVRARHGVPVDATSVVLNVAIADPSGPGYATVFPCGTDRPTTSNINYDTGRTASNVALSKVGSDGKICIFTTATAHVVVDVNGAYAPSGDSMQHAFDPYRLLDTRGTAATMPAGTVLVVPIAGHGDVASDATAAMLNVTVTGSSEAGYATVYPCGVKPPLASNLNFAAASTVPNLVFATIGADGAVCIYLSTSASVIVDISGSANPADLDG